MSRAAAVLLALFFAVHVSIGPVPAPVPVVLAFASVIGGLVWLIFESAFRNIPYRAAGT